MRHSMSCLAIRRFGPNSLSIVHRSLVLTTEDNSATSEQDGDKTIAQTPAKSQCLIARQALQTPAGLLFGKDSIVDRISRQHKTYELKHLLPKGSDNLTEVITPSTASEFFIPQVKLHTDDGSERKRVLCRLMQHMISS